MGVNLKLKKNHKLIIAADGSAASGKSTGRIQNQPDFYKEVIDQKGQDISATAERDISKMLDRMFKKAGFK